jgi:hypothetical protein
MSYRLYRVPTAGGDIADGSLLGQYDTFDAALEARDDDTATLFAQTELGASLLACHQIVGVDLADGVSSCPVTTHIPRANGAAPGDVEDVRAWLRRVHSPLPPTSFDEA